MKRSRRQFLHDIGASGGVICMPAFLAGCGVMPATDFGAAPPANPFLEWFGVDELLLARVMSELTARGATHADIYLQHRREHRLRLRDGVKGAPDITMEQGAGLRVIVNGETGFASTEDLSLQGLIVAARQAAQRAAGAAAVSPAEFLSVKGSNFYPVATDWSSLGIERRWPILERLAASGYAADPSVSDVAVDWQDSDERILIATLDGQIFLDERPLTRISAQVKAQRGTDVQAGFASISARQDVHWYDDVRIDALARTAADRALIRFEAKQPPLGAMPVLLAAGSSGIVLHEALGHALEADFGARGSGAYAGLLGQAVASPLVSVIDDATMFHQRGALNVDDEGERGRQNVLIDRGVLRTYLHDRLSASAIGVSPTGSGRRESYRFMPMPRMTCTRIESGSETRDDLLAAVERGVWAKTYSNGRVDPVTGDFSFLIKNGWFVERGRASYPVRDVRLTGNGPDMLRNVQRLANDGRMDEAGWTCGKRGQRVPVSHGMPTALVTGLRIES
ncbi:MAG: TldD/PmbA family protein [Woeseia sp.]|nr:TldD/PmbA family protein [Woeseia sp.]